MTEPNQEQQQQPTQQQPPAWQAVTPQFQSPEALAESYRNLQGELTRVKQQLNQPPQPKPQPTQQPTAEPSFDWTNPNQYLKDTGFDDSLVDYLSATSKMPKEIAQQFGKTVVQAQKILKEQSTRQALEISGGPDRWAAVQQYMGSMPDHRKAAIAPALENPETMSYTLRGIVAEMESQGVFNQQRGSQEPAPLPTKAMTNTPLQGEPLMPGSPQLSQAIQDPRYNANGPLYDPNYAKSVGDRIKAGARLASQRR